MKIDILLFIGSKENKYRFIRILSYILYYKYRT